MVGVAHILHSSRQRHLAAKRAAVQSPQALAEILGVPVSSLPSSAVATPSPLASSSSTPQPEIKPEIKPDVKPTLADPESASALKSERTSEDVVTTSKLSVSDYFRQKMREKMLIRQAAAGGSRVKVEDLPAHSLENMVEEEEKKPAVGSEWEGTKMTFKEQLQEFEPSDSTTAIPKEEDEKTKKRARKEAKRLAKLDKEKGKSKGHDPIHEAHQTLEAFEHAGEVKEEDKDEKKRQKEEKKRKRDEKEVKEKEKKRKRDDDEDEKKDKKDRKSREGQKEKERKKKKEKSP